MEPNSAPPPLPLSATVTTTTADSIDSSHSLTTTSWGDHNGATAAAAKLRLMCSYGGHIVPRPHDKSLCYVGGDTRIVVIDRHTTLIDLTHRLSKTLLRSSSTPSSSSFSLKYQLPSEDLDSLISVTTDEDLENMIDEYERLNSSSAGKSSRLRLFLFPTKSEPVSSIGSLLENSVKSEDWFLDALNGTTSGFSDTSSVNYLLGLDEDALIPEKKDCNKVVVVKGNQDVQSVPDSPMMENSSSFGSASSSLVNLPPIRVHGDDHLKLQQHQYQQKQATGFDLASPDSVSSDNSLTNPLSRQKPALIYQDSIIQTQNNRASEPNNIPDQNTRIQIQQQKVQDSAYLMSMPTTTQVDTQHPQSHHQQPQFIHTAVPLTQYIQHHPSGAVPMPSYYQMYPSQGQHRPHHVPIDQPNFVYYMPARQPPQPQLYNLPNYADASAANPSSHNQPPPQSGVYPTQTAPKGELPAGLYRPTNSSAPQLVQVLSSQQAQPHYVGMSHLHHPSQSAASSASGGGGNYGVEFADNSQGQHIYYGAQTLLPHSAAQYQTMTSTSPVEPSSHLPIDNNMKQQQVRTSQP